MSTGKKPEREFEGKERENVIVVNSIELLSLKELRVESVRVDNKCEETSDHVKCVKFDRKKEYVIKKINEIQDGFVRVMLKNHNNSVSCRFVLNSGLFEYLDEKDYIEASMVCKLWFAEANSVKSYQKRYPVGMNYFNNKKRSWIWRCVLFGEDKYIMDPNEDEMFRYLKIEDELSSVYEKMGITEYYDEIMRDVSRTFPKLKDFQKKENQTKMLRILFKISYAFPEVGYCQGMNYLVGILLYAFDFNVEQVYSSIISILIKWEYEDIYNKELTKLKEMCFIFNELIKEYLPELYNQVFYNKYEVNAENKITSELFAIQWFLTLFIYDIADTDYAINSVYILDNIIIHDTNSNFNINVYKIAISLLSRIFKDFKLGNDVEIIHILEFIRQRSKYILTTISEIEELLNESKNLLLPETLLQKIYVKYKQMSITKENTDEKSVSDTKNVNGRTRETLSKLLRKYKLFNYNQNSNKNSIYINEDDSVPSPFHPYFSI